MCQRGAPSVWPRLNLGGSPEKGRRPLGDDSGQAEAASGCRDGPLSGDAVKSRADLRKNAYTMTYSVGVNGKRVASFRLQPFEFVGGA